jgi:hypothetical protein
VEAQVAEAPGNPPVPWLVSNPIFRLSPRAETAPRERSVVLELNPSWRIEKDDGSRGTVSTDERGRAEFAYTLRNDGRVSQFVALVTDVANLTEFEALAFSIKAATPRRVSVQLRFARDGQVRWGKSVYADAAQRVVSIPLDQLRRAEGAAERPPAARATSLLFVVDLTNAVPGDSGKFEVEDVRFLR